MPGVLIEGGPRGRDEERACRLRPAEGASLYGSAWGPSERIMASPVEDMAVVVVSLGIERSVPLEGWKRTETTRSRAKHAPR